MIYRVFQIHSIIGGSDCHEGWLEPNQHINTNWKYSKDWEHNDEHIGLFIQSAIEEEKTSAEETHAITFLQVTSSNPPELDNNKSL